jgi:hypothetical protein
LDPRITFTRGSIGTFVNKNGLIETIPANVPRFYYDPISGECKGLLIEESRTNLVTDNSTNFNYAINNQIIATENDVALDGTTVLCKHNLTGATTPFLNCRANTTLSAGNTYTMSMWLKGTTNFNASFAFIGETTNEIYANTANITTTWQRFTLTFTLVATQTASRLQVFFGRQGEAKIISIWGAQLEQGAFATSYVPRSSTQQSTRSADLASITGTNFSSWYNSSEGSIFFSGRTGNSIEPSLLTFSDTSSLSPLNFLRFTYQFLASRFIGVYSSSGMFSIYSSNTFSSGSFFKTISTYKLGGDVTIAANGKTVVKNTSKVIPTVNRLNLGDNSSYANYLNGTISRLTYYPKVLSPSQLQYLTQ